MAKAARFTQADITKALKGAKAAGFSVKRITVDPEGNISLEFGAPEESEPNEWDVVFDRKPRGHF